MFFTKNLERAEAKDSSCLKSRRKLKKLSELWTRPSSMIGWSLSKRTILYSRNKVEDQRDLKKGGVTREAIVIGASMTEAIRIEISGGEPFNY